MDEVQQLNLLSFSSICSITLSVTCYLQESVEKKKKKSWQCVYMEETVKLGR